MSLHSGTGRKIAHVDCSPKYFPPGSRLLVKAPGSASWEEKQKRNLADTIQKWAGDNVVSVLVIDPLVVTDIEIDQGGIIG